MESSQHKHIHHNAGLHIGHTWPIGDIALNGERPAFWFSLGENRVPMPHQHDVLLLIAGSDFMRAGHNAAQAIAMLFARHDFHRDALALQKVLHLCAGAIHARLVIGTTIGIHHFLEFSDHGVLLCGKPGGDLGFGGHAILNIIGIRPKPALATLRRQGRYSILPSARITRSNLPASSS